VPGVTTTVEPDKLPGCHIYVDAPLALSVKVVPVQPVADGVTELVMVGIPTVLIVINRVELDVHPWVLVPVMV
jgi:hypothetical protein